MASSVPAAQAAGPVSTAAASATPAQNAQERRVDRVGRSIIQRWTLIPTLIVGVIAFTLVPPAVAVTLTAMTSLIFFLCCDSGSNAPTTRRAPETTTPTTNTVPAPTSQEAAALSTAAFMDNVALIRADFIKLKNELLSLRAKNAELETQKAELTQQLALLNNAPGAAGAAANRCSLD